MKFMPAQSEEMCKQVSGLLYKLTRPEGAENDTTEYLFGWQQDKNGQWFMQWNENLVLPVHVARSNETLLAVSSYVEMGLVSPQSAQNLATIVQENQGGTVTLGQITPPEWLQVMRDEILIEDVILEEAKEEV
jgi:hypothetical protein